MLYYARAVPLGMLFTAAIFLLMTLLIAHGPAVTVDTSPRTPIEWIKIPERDSAVVTVKPSPIDRQPPPAPVSRMDSTSDSGLTRVGTPVPAPPQPDGRGFALNFQPDGPLVVMTRVQPIYPQAAIERGIEGFVDLIFDVSPDGRVDNVRIRESSHSILEASAIKAALRFRFKARIVEGIAQSTSDVRYRFNFALD